jgi:1,4-alpha-glucan branching enzyme
VPCVSGHESATRFAVWAPNARVVSVIGDFNGCSPEMHPMAMIVLRPRC